MNESLLKQRPKLEHKDIPQPERSSSKEAPVVKLSGKLMQMLGIPQGAFSTLSTIGSGGKVEEYLSLELNKILAEQFTNYRYVVKNINKSRTLFQKLMFKKVEEVGPITTKDPREKYEGDIDKIIKQTKSDLASFRQTVDEVKEKLEQRAETEGISKQGLKRAEQLLSDYTKVYEILLKELGLKKRGLKLQGGDEMSGRNIIKEDLRKSNTQLEIKPLPGGGIVILRGYTHYEDWQKNFGDSRKQDFGLADIYSGARYVGIEGFANGSFGESLGVNWKNNKKHYDELMRQLVKVGFSGDFLELDGRCLVENILDSFDRKDLTEGEAKILFNYLKKLNPKQAERIGNWQQYRELFHHQRTFGKQTSFINQRITFNRYTGPSLTKNMQKEGLDIIKDGTCYSNRTSLNKDLTFSSSPTGFELGQSAFSDALSVIKILLMNKAMLDGNLEQGLLVDFQGTNHLHYKSFFIDNPQYAMEVVLTNVHEIIPSLPGIKSTEDVLKKLRNMDKETWMQVFKFIGKIPFTQVEESTDERDSTEIGERQRKMSKPKYYSVIEEKKPELDKMIEIIKK